MVLETSTSSPDNAMAKKNAINSVIQSGKESLNQLSSFVKSNYNKLLLVATITSTAPAVFSQSNAVAKNNVPGIGIPASNSVDGKLIKIGEDPIKDSAQYKAERDKLLKEWDRVSKEKEHVDLVKDQLKMLSGPISFFEKVQERGGSFTEQDGKRARAGIIIIDKTVWLSEVQDLVPKVRKLLVYISNQAPGEVVVKN